MSSSHSVVVSQDGAIPGSLSSSRVTATPPASNSSANVTSPARAERTAPQAPSPLNFERSQVVLKTGETVNTRTPINSKDSVLTISGVEMRLKDAIAQGLIELGGADPKSGSEGPDEVAPVITADDVRDYADSMGAIDAAFSAVGLDAAAIVDTAIDSAGNLTDAAHAQLTQVLGDENATQVVQVVERWLGQSISDIMNAARVDINDAVLSRIDSHPGYSKAVTALIRGNPSPMRAIVASVKR